MSLPGTGIAIQGIVQRWIDLQAFPWLDLLVLELNLFVENLELFI